MSSPLQFGGPEDCEEGTQRAFTSLEAVPCECCVLSFFQSSTLCASIITHSDTQRLNDADSEESELVSMC